MRDYWQKLARRTGDPDAWVEYRNLKREVKREIRQAERESIANQVKRKRRFDYEFLRSLPTMDRLTGTLRR